MSTLNESLIAPNPDVPLGPFNEMSPSNAKRMPELSILTILIQAASAIKNGDGDTSLQGYVEEQEITTRRMVSPNEIEVNFAVLDSIGDILLQNNQVLAISPDIRVQDESCISVLIADSKADSELELPAEFPIRGASKVVPSINATVVPNPDDRRDVKRGGGQSGGPLGNIKQVTGGISLWNEIEKDPLFCAVNMDCSSPEGLANHAETLSDYLYEYGKHKDRRSHYSRQFFIYLLSACWRKLHRRFSSWQGLSLIRNLEKYPILFKDQLDQIGDENESDQRHLDPAVGPGDRSLVHFLHLNEEILFKSMLPLVFPTDMEVPPPEPELEKLRNAVNKAFKDENLECFYTRDTALEFHYLVYGAFLLAGQAIRRIEDQRQILSRTRVNNKSYNSSVEDLKTYIRAAVLPMKLLQSVLSSSVFQRHVHIWTDNGADLNIILPKWADKKDDLEFGRRRQIVASSKLGPSDESPTEGRGENDGGSPTDDGDDGDDGINDDINNAPEMSGVSSSGLEMFFGWVRTFVACFLGKRNLEVFTARLASAGINKRPEITVFSVGSQLYQMPAWEEIQKVIKDALVGYSEEKANYVVRRLRGVVTSNAKLHPEAQRSVALLRDIMEQRRETLVLRMHCEAVVAALLESSTNPESNILAELSESLADNIVSVTKLCCPVCWELFEVLGRKNSVRGCHPTVTPIVLPETLPNHVSEKMVDRFRAHLSRQLSCLSWSTKAPEVVTGHRRNSSETGYSATSSIEGATKLDSDSQYWERGYKLSQGSKMA